MIFVEWIFVDVKALIVLVSKCIHNLRVVAKSRLGLQSINRGKSSFSRSINADELDVLFPVGVPAQVLNYKDPVHEV
jgi:hypothetical protein